MNDTEKLIIIYVTTPTIESARQISKILVAEQLAACCTIIPGAISIYSWENKTEEQQEYVMMIKSAESKFESIRKRITELHSFEVPEIIAVEAKYSDVNYKKWVIESIEEN